MFTTLPPTSVPMLKPTKNIWANNTVANATNTDIAVIVFRFTVSLKT